MIPYWMSRTQLLLGDEKIERLMNAHVLVVGLGGVGAIAAEMVARAGVGKMTIVDADVVEASNRNRQVPALSSTEGKLKSEVLGERLKDINPELELTILSEYLKDERLFEILDSGDFTYVMDCIDTLSPKTYLIRGCIERKIPIVSSMGAGGKLDPTKVRIADISQSFNCHLARYVRKRLHRMGIFRGLTVVFSEEIADRDRVIPTPNDDRKKSVIGTISYLPAIFGCTCASVVIDGICNPKKKKK